MQDRTRLTPLSPPRGAAAVEWRVAAGLVPYEEAVAFMEARAGEIAAGRAPELVWLVEHPPLYTAGTGAAAEDLAGADRFPTFRTGRGGKLTYHGPGQRVGYVMLDLKHRGADVRRFVLALEEWLIGTLARFGVKGERRTERIGVWVRRPDQGAGREDKIAALGIRVKKWVTLHGVSLNVAPDLSHYAGILPCGIAEQNFRVTSLADLGVKASMADVDKALAASFVELFGPIELTPSAGSRTARPVAAG
ncbi:MAG TPA: lipoyl(octanoyl) transferase LipB [Xanthobacteraceae bacterium]|nr:lipoyl(octanoyl) transferase LipB [Xanthobacteraceae bacterium]